MASRKTVSPAPRLHGRGAASRTAPARVRDVIAAADATVPAFLHDPGDPPPFAFGDPDAAVRRVCVALDADRAAVDVAVRARADMVVAHHPPFYRAPRSLNTATEAGALAAVYARAGLAVYALHLALDQAPDGTADALAALVGLRDTAVLSPHARARLLKLTVFTPPSHHEAVRRAVAEAGAGKIGAYSACSFTADGEGAFRPGAGARPFIGTPLTDTRTPERRLEAVLSEDRRGAVEAALRAAHPYEEPAYDFTPTLQERVYGFGRVGPLPRATTLPALARRLAEHADGGTAAYGAAYTPAESGRARVPSVRTVAVWPGAGCPVGLVAASGADTVVTGELGYHDRRSLADRGVSWITLGHGGSERPVLADWARRLSARLPNVAVTVSRAVTLPPTYVMAPMAKSRRRNPS